MIEIFNLQTEEPNIEVMTVACEETAGVTPCYVCHLIRTDLNPSQQVTYDNFVGLLGDTVQDEILNTIPMMNIQRVTSTVLTEGKTTKDYTVDFDTIQQGYVDDFLQLTLDLKDHE